MGHLFSRAFKRLTQGNSQSRNSQSSSHQSEQSHQHAEQQDKDNHDIRESGRSSVQAIPVGQSIDSAEYAALETNNSSSRQNNSNNNQSLASNNNNKSNNRQTVTDENKQQGVEEAVIKIQALVRGHLTRKALKDAHHHNVPPPPSPNALGQSQFDEESLTRNPPSSIFLSSSSHPKLAGDFQQQAVASSNKTMGSPGDQPRTPLASIAEDTETTAAPTFNTASNTTTITSTTTAQLVDHDEDNSERKHNRSHTTPSPLNLATPPPPPRSGSVSPALSEAAASIDLNCDTPASASIDIMDHNIVPTDRMASVLHHKEEAPKAAEQSLVRRPPSLNTPPEHGDVGSTPGEVEGLETEAEATFMGRVPTVGTPDSLESEEAAAVRIQSAFRGYRTRKNSPYRTRSPNSPLTNTTTTNTASANRNALSGQQEANVLRVNGELLRAPPAGNLLDGDDDDVTVAAIGERDITMQQQQQTSPTPIGRRSSRPRQRESSPTTIAANTATDEAGIGATEKQLPKSGIISDVSPPLDEFTTTTEETTTNTTTVKELPQHAAHTIESAMETVKLDEQNRSDFEIATNNNQQELKSLSTLDSSIGGQSAATDNNTTNTTLDDLSGALSAALEAAQTSTTNDELVDSAGGLNPAGAGGSTPQTRSSVAKSDASVELDTDSSVLGAALSLTDDVSSSDGAGGQTIAPSAPALEPIEEADRSHPGEVSMMSDIELESEARKLVDGMIAEDGAAAAEARSQAAHDNSTECALEEATNELEAALEVAANTTEGATDDTTFAKNEQLLLLNEDEQRAIELESDDIEKRDPRGVKSPQIRTEELHFDISGASEASAGGGQLEDVTDQEVSESGGVGGNLTVEQSPAEEQATASGQSSPALNSSGAASSADEAEDAGEGESESGEANKTQTGGQNKKQQQQQQSGNASKNKKKNNRNKRKGKK